MKTILISVLLMVVTSVSRSQNYEKLQRQVDTVFCHFDSQMEAAADMVEDGDKDWRVAGINTAADAIDSYLVLSIQILNQTENSEDWFRLRGRIMSLLRRVLHVCPFESKALRGIPHDLPERFKVAKTTEI